jgi:hypothetical protein
MWESTHPAKAVRLTVRDVSFKIEKYEKGQRVYVQKHDGNYVEVDFMDGTKEPVVRLHNACIS